MRKISSGCLIFTGKTAVKLPEEKRINMSEPELKPCPFCDGEPRIGTVWLSPTKRYMGRCLQCIAEGPSEDTEEAAIKTWNNRPIEEGLRVRGEVLMRALRDLMDAQTPASVFDGVMAGARLSLKNWEER